MFIAKFEVHDTTEPPAPPRPIPEGTDITEVLQMHHRMFLPPVLRVQVEAQSLYTISALLRAIGDELGNIAEAREHDERQAQA